jgi:hypothetical protein
MVSLRTAGFRTRQDLAKMAQLQAHCVQATNNKSTGYCCRALNHDAPASQGLSNCLPAHSRIWVLLSDQVTMVYLR